MKNTGIALRWQVVLLVVGALCASSIAWSKGGIGSGSNDEKTTSKLYQSLVSPIEPNKAMLKLFFNRMPKGGDLHHHLKGSIYVESYLDWVAQKQWSVNSCSFKVVAKKPVKGTGKCRMLSVAQLMDDPGLYRRALMQWSVQDYSTHLHAQPAPAVKLLKVLNYAESIADEYVPTGLQAIKQRAVQERVSYMESLISRSGVQVSTYFNQARREQFNSRLRAAKSQEEIDKILSEVVHVFHTSPQFQQEVDSFVAKTRKNHTGVDSNEFLMRYLVYADRTQTPLQVFTDLFAGAEMARVSKLIVGVGLGGQESHAVALADYGAHMGSVSYLSTQYPGVGRAVHAGEFAVGEARPQTMSSHLWKALDPAGADRIGNAVDLLYEDNPVGLLSKMEVDDVVIEINLTSNEFVFGLKDMGHPYPVYSRYGIPMVISTDYSGVLRTTLTNEYFLLATRYRPPYRIIKEHVYNSIRHSFLPSNLKAQRRKLLDSQFAAFESEMAAFSLR